MPADVRERFKADPIFYVEKVLGSSLWEKQKEIITAVERFPKVTVKSCHGSGKTYTAARVALRFIHRYPSSIVVTTAPTFTQVRDLLWKEIKAAYRQAPIILPGEMLETRYVIKDNWYAIGRSTDEPVNFQGYHAPYILVIVDEADGVPREIFEAIEGVISTGHAHLLLIGNPIDPTSYFAQSHASAQFEKLTISCFDTPNFATIPSIEALMAMTDEQRKDAVVYPYLIQPQWAYERALEWGVESPLFHSRVLGKFPKSSDDTLIALSLVEKAIKDKLAGVERKGDDWQIGLDVARFGSDRTCFVIRHGNEVVDIQWFMKEDTMQTAGRAIDFLKEYPDAKMLIDEIGVGAGVVDRLKESEFSSRVAGVNVGAKAPEEADDSTKFVNLRARVFWTLRDRFINNDILLIDKGTVMSDVTNIKYKYRSDGAIQLESKDEMKKRIGRSPDIADALALAFHNQKTFTAESDFAIL